MKVLIINLYNGGEIKRLKDDFSGTFSVVFVYSYWIIIVREYIVTEGLCYFAIGTIPRMSPCMLGCIAAMAFILLHL